MRTSAVLLSVSTAVNASAAFLSSRVVVPSLRFAADLKGKGLTRAYKELDKEYWKSVEHLQVIQDVMAKAAGNADAVLEKRRKAVRAMRAYEAERVL